MAGKDKANGSVFGGSLNTKLGVRYGVLNRSFQLFKTKEGA
jgi:hypothetical protein